MNKSIKKQPLDKKRLLKEQGHLTRSPRLEGAVKEAMMQPVRKKKKKGLASSKKRSS